MSRSGHRHVGEPVLVATVLAGSLEPRRVLLVGCRPHGAVALLGRALTLRDVERPPLDPLGRVVEGERRLGADPFAAVPQRREQHDRELEALGRVDGLDLHGVRVGLDAALYRIGCNVVGPRALQFGQDHQRCSGRDPTAADGLGVDQLGDVLEVGQVAFAERVEQEALHDAGLPPHGTEQGRHALGGHELGPGVQGLLQERDRLGGSRARLAVHGGGHRLGRPAKEPAEGRRKGARRAGRPVEGVQEGGPL